MTEVIENWSGDESGDKSRQQRSGTQVSNAEEPAKSTATDSETRPNEALPKDPSRSSLDMASPQASDNGSHDGTERPPEPVLGSGQSTATDPPQLTGVTSL